MKDNWFENFLFIIKKNEYFINIIMIETLDIKNMEN